MVFTHFFLSVQQDIKLWIFFPILCAVFRAIFIAVHKPYPSLTGKGKALRECFRFGFWWGMDLMLKAINEVKSFDVLSGGGIGLYDANGALVIVLEK